MIDEFIKYEKGLCSNHKYLVTVKVMVNDQDIAFQKKP